MSEIAALGLNFQVRDWLNVFIALLMLGFVFGATKTFVRSHLDEAE